MLADPGSTTVGPSGPSWLHRTALPAVSLALPLLVLTPVLGRGFVLTYDMVFAPRQWLTPDALGMGSALPRSVPVDAVVALATTVVPGDIVQKLILFLTLAAATLGAGRLVPTEATGVRLTAAVFYGWSAYVAERLFMGHWALLIGYAALPWVALAALALRQGKPGATARLILACAPAALTPTGGLLAAGVALALVGRHRLPRAIGIVAVLNAPWLVPSLLHPGGGLSDPLGLTAFAARSENWGGPQLSVLGLGGIWNSEVVPTSRGNPLLPVFTVIMVAVAMVGLRELASRWGLRPARALVVLGALGVLLAVATTLPFGAAVMGWLVETVPGAGLLRDAQKWAAWWALPFAIGFALGMERLARYLGRAAIVVTAAALFPVLLLPDLAFAGWGRLASAHYPDDWRHVAGILEDDPHPGDVLTLPLSAFRRFTWNDNRTQLDPAPRVLPRATVIDDTLTVGGVSVTGEDERVAAVRRAMADGESLATQGIGWVLVEHGTPGRVDQDLLSRLDKVHEGSWLTLYRVPGELRPAPGGPARAPILAANGAAAALVIAGLLWCGLPIGRLNRRRLRDPVREE